MVGHTINRMKTDTGVGEGLVRIKVTLPKARTTVSLDDVLYGALIERCGGSAAADLWIKGQAAAIHQHVVERGVGEQPVEVDASLSRLVQRQALRLVLGQIRGP